MALATYSIPLIVKFKPRTMVVTVVRRVNDEVVSVRVTSVCAVVD